MEFLSDEVRGNMTEWEYLSADVLDFGKILLYVITKGKHGGDAMGEKDILDLENILEQIPRHDEEVKNLLRQVLEKDYRKRPSLEKILQHPMFCDWQSRIDLLGEVSDFCELKKSQWRKANNGSRHVVVKALDDYEGPNVFGTDGWKGIFANDDILREAEKNKTYPYDYYSLTDLLRIFRNIITHLTDFKANFKDAFGNTKQETEYIFRKKFPKLFTIVREVAKLHLREKFRLRVASSTFFDDDNYVKDEEEEEPQKEPTTNHVFISITLVISRVVQWFLKGNALPEDGGAAIQTQNWNLM
ncbi:serine/threonine-protein kinase/endoribonuclease IRE1a-like protein [Tanacetum coccineum]